MRLFRRLLPALLLLLAAAPLAAQQVRGRVVDEGGQSVKAATVYLLDGEGRRVAGTHTDDEGTFALRVPREGSYRLRAQRIGYGQAVTDTMEVGGRISLELTLRLSVRAVALAPLTITAQQPPRLPRLVSVGFYRRQEQGQGTFFEREDIERQRPLQMSALVSQVSGVVVMSGGSLSAGDVVMMRGSHCLPSVWLDGRLARAGGQLAEREWSGTEAAEARLSLFSRREPRVRHHTTMDELITPNEVEAVEVYRGPSEVPAIFAFMGGSCGAVVVWTQFHAGLAADTR